MLHSAKEYTKVIRLRRQKKSYSEIQKLTHIPKSTLSDWLSEEEWSVKIKNELNDKSTLAFKLNIVKAIEAQAKLKKSRDKKYIQEARKSYTFLKNDPLFIYGLGLYWGEGDKKTRSRVAFTNTDPNMVRLMAQFFRDCLNVRKEKLRVELFIYEDIEKEFAINFWSNLLKIPTTQFIKTQVLKSRAKLTKTKSKYGICNLYFSSTELSIKILEWIRLISLDLRD